jgi:hypothetical protein
MSDEEEYQILYTVLRSSLFCRAVLDPEVFMLSLFGLMHVQDELPFQNI